MKVIEPVNRVAVEQKMWDDREARFVETFKAYPNAIKSRAFSVEKLEYYEEVQKKFKNSPDKDERMAARFLKEKATKLEKQLYPSQTVRFLRRFLNSVARQPSPPLPIQPAIQVVEKKMNARLKADLIRSGLGSVLNDVERQIKQGRNEIKAPSELIFESGEKSRFNVDIKQDKAGNHQLIGFEASIPNKNAPGEMITQQYHFEDNKEITTRKAFNQLNGRSIAVDYGKGADKQVNMVGLDFNDKDAAGNYKKKEFPMESFDWKKEIAALPLKEMGQPLINKLEKGILEGNRMQITFLKAGNERTFYIESNPLTKLLILSDDKQNTISLKNAISLTENKEIKLDSMFNPVAYLQDQFNKMPLLSDTKEQLDKTMSNLLAGKSGKVILRVEDKPHTFSVVLDKNEGLIIRDQAKQIVSQKEMWKRWTPEPQVKPGLDTIKQVEMTFTKTPQKEVIKEQKPPIKMVKEAKKRSRGIK